MSRVQALQTILKEELIQTTRQDTVRNALGCTQDWIVHQTELRDPEFGGVSYTEVQIMTNRRKMNVCLILMNRYALRADYKYNGLAM